MVPLVILDNSPGSIPATVPDKFGGSGVDGHAAWHMRIRAATRVLADATSLSAELQFHSGYQVPPAADSERGEMSNAKDKAKLEDQYESVAVGSAENALVDALRAENAALRTRLQELEELIGNISLLLRNDIVRGQE